MLLTACNISPILSSLNWLDLAPDVTATNTTGSAVDNPNGATPRFYRVQIVP